MPRRANGEGSRFAAHGNGFKTRLWVDDPARGRRRISVIAPTEKELAAKVRTIMNDLDAGRGVTASRTPRVRDYAVGWMDTTLAAREVTPGTRRAYRLAVTNHVLPVIGDVQVGRLTAAHVEKVDLGVRSKGLSDSTRRLVYNVTRMLLDTAVRDHLLRVNPAAEIARPVDHQKKQPVHDAKNAARVVDACQGRRTLAELVPLMLWTATRPGEALALRWCDVDLGARTLWVTGTLAVDEDGRVFRAEVPKDKEPREIPLLDRAVHQLRAARQRVLADRLAAGAAYVDNDLVFADELGGLLDDRSLRAPFRVVMAGLELAGSFHAMRRSSATMMNRAGVPLPVIAQILGHSSTAVTARSYTYTDPAMMRAALDTLDASMS